MISFDDFICSSFVLSLEKISGKKVRFSMDPKKVKVIFNVHYWIDEEDAEKNHQKFHLNNQR